MTDPEELAILKQELSALRAENAALCQTAGIRQAPLMPDCDLDPSVTFCL